MEYVAAYINAINLAPYVTGTAQPKMNQEKMNSILIPIPPTGEVLPFAPDAWIDEKKSKVGYEIPFTRYFYKYEAPRPSA